MQFQSKEIIGNGFVFNMDKCVGCQACILACSIENKTILAENWRYVYPVNHFNYSEVPLLHFSLACNHCKDAPCIRACPSEAYSRSQSTGAVVVDARKCIGCNYCSWVCPFDAPKMHLENGTIEKCNFCFPRIENGQKPACVANCPLGALQYEEIDRNSVQMIPGFSRTGIKPMISIVSSKIKSKKTEMDQDAFSEPEGIKTKLYHSKEKIVLKKEWQLALLTSFIAILYSVYVSFNPLLFNMAERWLFIFSGAIAVGLSFFHLGKPWRAWRAISNIKSSWLSREIFFFSLFSAFSISSFYIEDYYLYFRLFAIMCGLLTVISVDILYRKLALEKKIKLNGSETIIISAFLCVILSPSPDYVKIILVLAKFILVMYLHLKKSLTEYKWFYLSFRFLVGVLLPVIMIKINPWFFVIPLLLTEITDRFIFYKELKIITPEKQILLDYNMTCNEK